MKTFPPEVALNVLVFTSKVSSASLFEYIRDSLRLGILNVLSILTLQKSFESWYYSSSIEIQKVNPNVFGHYGWRLWNLKPSE